MENAPIGPRRPRIHLAPTTTAGLWAAWLLAAFVAGVVIYVSLAAAYQIITGDEAFDNFRAPLVGVLLTTEVAGVLAGVAAASAVFRRGERSVLAFLGLIVLVITPIVFVFGLVSG
jgi:DMSO reductase anchor subunit